LSELESDVTEAIQKQFDIQNASLSKIINLGTDIDGFVRVKDFVYPYPPNPS